MWYSLPTQQRLNLMKSYKTAYPGMSYNDMIEHFNQGAKQYGEGGKVNTLEGDIISNVLMNRNRDKDFVQRAYAVGQYPNSNMFQTSSPDEFGANQSHMMAWGEDDKGQAYMFPTVMNDKNEAIKVPNQYADYISTEGYKKATGMKKHGNGGPLSATPYNEKMNWMGEQYSDAGVNISNNKIGVNLGNYVPLKTNEKTPLFNPNIGLDYTNKKGNTFNINASPGYVGVGYTHNFGNGGKVEPPQIDIAPKQKKLPLQRGEGEAPGMMQIYQEMMKAHLAGEKQFKNFDGERGKDKVASKDFNAYLKNGSTYDRELDQYLKRFRPSEIYKGGMSSDHIFARWNKPRIAPYREELMEARPAPYREEPAEPMPNMVMDSNGKWVEAKKRQRQLGMPDVVMQYNFKGGAPKQYGGGGPIKEEPVEEPKNSYYELYGKPKLNLTPQQVQKVVTAKPNQEARKELIKRKPHLHTVEDYKAGIKEPGVENDILSDPVAMAAGTVAGGVGLGAYSLSQVPRMFATELLSEATAGLSDLTKSGLKSAGEYLTTQTPLKNTYKYNPWAFKPEKGRMYRQVGQPGFDDALKEGKILEKNQKEFLEQNPNFDLNEEYNTFIKRKGINLQKPAPAPFFMKDDLFFPIDRKALGKGNKKTAFSDAEYLFESKPYDNNLSGYVPKYRDKYLKLETSPSTYVLDPKFSGLENFNTYKRHWLQGYKKIETPGSSYPSFKSITGNPEHIDQEHLSGLIKRETDWLRSPEYIKRKKAATGKSEEAIKKESEKIINNINNTTIEYTGKSEDAAQGLYSPGKNPKISIFNGDTDYLRDESVLRHEAGHAFSEMGIPGDDLVKFLKGEGYKNYPKVNLNKTIGDKALSLLGQNWENLAPEQQVVGRRIMDLIEETQGLKRGTQLTEDNTKTLIAHLKKNINSVKDEDVLTIMSAFKKKFGEGYSKQLTDFLNKAYAVPALGVVGANQLMQNKDKKQ